VGEDVRHLDVVADQAPLLAVLYTNETPSYDLYRVPVSGSGSPSVVLSNVRDKYPRSVSPDGNEVAYEESWPGGERIRATSLDGSGPGRVLGDSTLRQANPYFSPDGRWIAARASTRPNTAGHIFVMRADGTGGAVQVTAGESGEDDPRWTRGGRELVFRRGNAVVSVDIDPATGEGGRERKLFEGEYLDDGYDVTADGSRFLMVKGVHRPDALPILVITNFFEELRRKVGQ
jgi:Tol biopolymer transport system component